MQKYNPETLFHSKTNLSGFIIDETQLKVGSSELIWLWVAIESEGKEILGIKHIKEAKYV
jgi:transposase-like protein